MQFQDMSLWQANTMLERLGQIGYERRPNPDDLVELEGDGRHVVALRIHWENRSRGRMIATPANGFHIFNR